MFKKFFLLLVSLLNPNLTQKCRLNTREHFYEPLPILLKDGHFLEPTNSNGDVVLNHGDVITVSCEGVGPIRHYNAIHELETATISCDAGENFVNNEWLSGPSSFTAFRCQESPPHSCQRTNRTCFEGNIIYEVGYKVQDRFYAAYESCFNEGILNPIYSKYTQKSYNANFQTRIERPRFIDDGVYSRNFEVPVNDLFSPPGQRRQVARLVGNKVETYFSKAQELSRGHLAAKTDFVFAFTERATFHYVNCAPQWTGFNGGNWNSLEVDLRLHINQKGYDTVIYTGTSGVSRLENEEGEDVDIYLYTDRNNNPVIPVPMFFYKVVYAPQLQEGIAFVGINNPFRTAYEARRLFFCRDVCRDNEQFSWMSWEPDNPRAGITFCCTLTEFQEVIRHLPPLQDNGLLT